MHPKTTGAFIASLRKEKNLTQKQLAEKINVSDKAISRWETGKGYPDIESLMALSKEFSVSVNELLCGRRIDDPEMAQTTEKSIAGAYLEARRKKNNRTILAAVLAIAVLVSGVCFAGIYHTIIGSSNCVIAQDYAYIMLFDQRYVPLQLEDTECVISTCLIEEAQVEGKGFFSKLFFGEKIYSVKQCANNEIIYLQTETDSLETPYYCLADRLDEYTALSQQGAYAQLYAQIITEDWGTCDLPLDTSIAQMLVNEAYTVSPTVNCSWSRGKGDESITVYSAQQNSPFIRKEGELLRKQGVHYWFDYDDIPATQENADYSGIKAYVIADAYDEVLDVLFSYMFQ